MKIIFSPKCYAKFCVIVVLYVFRAIGNCKHQKLRKSTVCSFGFGQFQKISANEIL